MLWQVESYIVSCDGKLKATSCHVLLKGGQGPWPECALPQDCPRVRVGLGAALLWHHSVAATRLAAGTAGHKDKVQYRRCQFAMNHTERHSQVSFKSFLYVFGEEFLMKTGSGYPEYFFVFL